MLLVCSCARFFLSELRPGNHDSKHYPPRSFEQVQNGAGSEITWRLVEAAISELA